MNMAQHAKICTYIQESRLIKMWGLSFLRFSQRSVRLLRLPSSAMWRRVSWYSTYVPPFGGTCLQSSVATLTKQAEGTSSRWYKFTRLHGVRKTAILLLGGWENALPSSRAPGIWRAVPDVSKDRVVFINPSRSMLPLMKKKTRSSETSGSQRHSYLPTGLNPQQLHCVLYNCWNPLFLLGSKFRKIKHINPEGPHKAVNSVK